MLASGLLHVLPSPRAEHVPTASATVCQELVDQLVSVSVTDILGQIVDRQTSAHALDRVVDVLSPKPATGTPGAAAARGDLAHRSLFGLTVRQVTAAPQLLARDAAAVVLGRYERSFRPYLHTSSDTPRPASPPTTSSARASGSHVTVVPRRMCAATTAPS